jgi:hypothetical protein
MSFLIGWFALSVCAGFDDGRLFPLKSTVLALAGPLADPRAGGGSGLLLPIFLTSTQSGSGDGVNGLLGLIGLGKWLSDGGCTLERAGRPCEDQ